MVNTCRSNSVLTGPLPPASRPKRPKQTKQYRELVALPPLPPSPEPTTPNSEDPDSPPVIPPSPISPGCSTPPSDTTSDFHRHYPLLYQAPHQTLYTNVICIRFNRRIQR
ncbi:hypothetical protein VP01_71g9 [Puccinia sorghi]|uniref:Uncharacterized protein n=1 Tax=Puccinia sorghi TaxID=27349 RepID=A0A0L6UDC6_9BASI|nr:hypothetical protein VP01_71g9 [Puccinia sorghi]